jgi:hypothetical protein
MGNLSRSVRSLAFKDNNIFLQGERLFKLQAKVRQKQPVATFPPRSAPLKHPIQRLETRREHNIPLEQFRRRDEVLLRRREEDVLDRAS